MVRVFSPLVIVLHEFQQVMKDGRKLFMGAVGSWYWQGQIFSQDMLVRTDILSTTEQPAHFDDSYLGYSMATGEFTGDSEADIAVGVPRGNNLTGKVQNEDKLDCVLEARKVVVFNSTLSAVYELVGEQIGSYFGYSICILDVDGDSFDDVVVSAPMYSNFSSKDGSYETGRIYVIYQGKNVKKFSRWHILNGDSTRARFGLSLASLGDINRDGYADFAVGAPYGGLKEAGAVYLFHGSKDGVLKKPSQVIYATDIQSNLKTFGFSIAGGLDIDSNEYTDLLIGAYEVDKVVLIKSRPVVSVMAKFDIEPERINLDLKTCSLLDSSQVSCVIVSTCLEYTGVGVPNKLEFEIQTILDSTMEKSPRLFFLSNEHKNRLNTTVEVIKNAPHCKQVFVYIKSNVRDKLTPITVEMTYALADWRAKQNFKLKPVLDQYVPTLLEKQVNIQKYCGKDNVCVPDLIINASANKDNYVMGSKEPLHLDVNITNRGEDAFEAMFFLELPFGVNYVTTDYKDLDFPLTCSAPNDTFNVLKCDIGNPLKANHNISFKIILDPFDSNSTDGRYDFIMEVNSTNPENDTTLQNNLCLEHVFVRVKVELRVSGVSYVDPVLYNKSITLPSTKLQESDIGPEIIHIYEVRNLGPSNILEAEVVLLWPTYTLSQNHLLYLLEQPEVIGNGICEVIPNINPDNVTVEHTTYSFGGNTVIPVDVETLNTNADENVTSTSVRHDRGSHSKHRKQRSTDADFQKELSCGPTLCTQIQCQVYSLMKNKSVLFRIRSRLWTETLVKYGFENVTISSKLVARVTKLPYSVKPDYLKHETCVVNTSVNPIDGHTYRRMVPWWIIAAAVCTGVLIFALLVLILWKLGFFKRKRPRDEFEREPLNKPEKNGILELGDEAL